MSTVARRDAGLWRDLRALRRYIWIPVAGVVVGVAAALLAGAFASGGDEARFRATVVVDALPPLFGPEVVPGPFDYARVATSDEVVAEVAAQHGTTADALRPRLSAVPRVNTPEIAFKVTGDGALAIASTWNDAFARAAANQTPALTRELTAPYGTQRKEAAARLQTASASAAANPDDAVAQGELAAAEENYQTASQLTQSYDVVASTITAQSFTVKAPHDYTGGLGSTPARVAAGALIGLVAGVLAAVGLDALMRRRSRDEAEQVPPSLRPIEERRLEERASSSR